MTETAIGVVEKNRTSELRGRFAEYHGRQYFDLRTYVTAGADDDRVPTRKGVTLPLDKLPRLLELIENAVVEAKELNMISHEDEAA